MSNNSEKKLNGTIIMPILFMLVVYCLKLKVRFLKIRFCRR